MAYPKFKYTDTALPLGASVYTLFNSVTAFPFGNGFQMLDIHRILLTLQNDHTGTIKCSRSTDRGTNWVRCVPDISVSAASSNDVNSYDFLVEAYEDFKIEWTNGGTNQTVFAPSIVGVPSRQVAV